MTALRRYDFRDPGQVVIDVLAKHDLQEDQVWLALVEKPSERQRVTFVTRLPVPAAQPRERRRELSDVLRAAVRAMPITKRAGGDINQAVMTIIARRGMTVFGRREQPWLLGWRYSNHLAAVFTGDVILLTEHGWCDLTTDWGGHQPRLALRSQSPPAAEHD